MLECAGELWVRELKAGSRAAAHSRRSGDVLTALVVTQTLGGDEEIVIDARVPGVAAAIVAIWRGAPIVVAMFIAALVTGLLRLTV